VEQPEEEDAFAQLLKSFNQSPECLLQVIETLREHGIDLAQQNRENQQRYKQMNCRITSLEKTVAVQQSIIMKLYKNLQEVQASLTKIQNSTVPTTFKLETAMAHLVKSKMQHTPETRSLDDQQLQELKQQVISTYTPDLLCQAVIKEVTELGPVDQMIHLAKRADRLSQIQRSYDPSSNFWLDPKPLAPEVISALKALPADTQQEKLNQFWQDITRIYNTDHVRCIQFEVENIITGMGTYGEKRNMLTEFLLIGQKLQESLKKSKKTSLFRGLAFRQKDKICKS
jgi:uncharacterized coiled-coil protein SlyX